MSKQMDGDDDGEILTADELGCCEMAGDLWNYFNRLKTMHPSDKADVTFHIHAIQNIVMARAAMRAFPTIFPRTGR